MRKIIACTFGALITSATFAALPPLSPEAQAAADLAKAKTAYGDKVAAYIKEKRKEKWLGRQHTEESKEKMRQARLGKPSPRKGYTTSEETKTKISNANKGRTLPARSEEYKTKMREIKKAYWSQGD